MRDPTTQILDASAAKTVYTGIRVIDRTHFADEPSPILKEVIGAVRVIELLDPVNFKRLVQHVRAIIVRPMKAQGYFTARLSEIHVNEKLVRAGDTNELVFVLVHEISHATIAAAGVRSQTLSERSREEAACERRVRAHIKRRARANPAWHDYLAYRNQLPLPTALTSDELWILQIEDRIASLTHGEAPRWMVRLAHFLYEKAQQRAALRKKKNAT